MKRLISRATGGLEHLLSLMLLAVVFVLAPQDWSFLETLLGGIALVATYQAAMAMRDRRLDRGH